MVGSGCHRWAAAGWCWSGIKARVLNPEKCTWYEFFSEKTGLLRMDVFSKCVARKPPNAVQASSRWWGWGFEVFEIWKSHQFLIIPFWYDTVSIPSNYKRFVVRKNFRGGGNQPIPHERSPGEKFEKLTWYIFKEICKILTGDPFVVFFGLGISGKGTLPPWLQAWM